MLILRSGGSKQILSIVICEPSTDGAAISTAYKNCPDHSGQFSVNSKRPSFRRGVAACRKSISYKTQDVSEAPSDEGAVAVKATEGEITKPDNDSPTFDSSRILSAFFHGIESILLFPLYRRVISPLHFTFISL